MDTTRLIPLGLTLLSLVGPANAEKAKPIDWAKAREHWAYQPLRVGPLPTAKPDWAATAVDRYIAVELAENGLEPSPQADRRVLAQRLHVDLLGLKPTFAEIEEFAADPHDNAYERQVDRLLASPAHGERWGRHWLDVARYADTKDLVLLYGKERLRPYAYTFRDYVIRALNEDLPFDEFVRDQLAADQTAPKDQPWRLGAMGFLTLGRLFDENPHDIRDDQIDTVTRGFLGLTVACARCHDHKYDAISQADYYALYSVFASSQVPVDLPLIEDPRRVPGGEAFEQTLAGKRKALQEHVDAQFAEITAQARRQMGEYLRKIALEKPDPLENAEFYLSLSPEDLRPKFLSRWRGLLQKRARPDDVIFGPWAEVMSLAETELPARMAKLEAAWRARPEINSLIKAALLANPPTSKAEMAAAYGQAFQQAMKASLEDAAARPLRELLDGPASPFSFPRHETFLHMSRVPRDHYGKLVGELDKTAIHAAHYPGRAMIMRDAQPHAPRIFLRGNPSTLGSPVTRRFLEVLGGQDFRQGSGRVELAAAVTHPANPLTSRVLVNRVWLHHFGQALVATPTDFGTRSQPPSHPELLDYLAKTLQAEGWSLKRLHRLLVCSRVYQQSSQDRPAARQADADNRWLWRMPRRRLDLETMRDSLLLASGRLDRACGGRAQDISGDPQNARRTVYAVIDRQDVPEMFRAFDFASPDQCAGQRPLTSVPQQALFAMNSPFQIEQVKSLAGGVEQVAVLYQRALARNPTATEGERARSFLADAETGAKLTPLEQLTQVLLMSNEFLFVD